MTELIQTRRLLIKSFSASDREALAKLLLDGEIKQTYMIPDFESREALERMIDAFVRLSSDGARFVRGVYLDGALIGLVNDVGIDDTGIELGYAFHPTVWNRGYATEMLGAVIDALLSSGFCAVKTGAFAENGASIRVMEKCGMRRLSETDTVSYRGQDHLCVYYEATGKPMFRRAEEKDAEAVSALYRSAVGSAFCTWNDLYPSMLEITHDLETENLYVLTERGQVIGALSVVPENELDEQSVWTTSDGSEREIARVVIAREHQGRGLALAMVQAITDMLRLRACRAIRLSVAKCNLPAYSTYCRAGFVTVGEAMLWGNDYYLMENILDI